MPELPDVQVQKEYLDATSLHRPVVGVFMTTSGLRQDIPPETLHRRIAGQSLESTLRHGKHLFVRAGKSWLRLHFGMTGYLAYFRRPDTDGPDPEHTRLRIDLEDGGHLAYISVRRFGEVGWVEHPKEFIAEHKLGPDALDPSLDAEALAAVLKGRRGSIKSALMNQRYIAGIGNIYADEILFQARIHPLTEAGSLNADQVKALHRQMRRVLQAAIDARVKNFPDWFLIPQRHKGGRCPKCGAELIKLKVLGRPSFICPGRQGAEALQP